MRYKVDWSIVKDRIPTAVNKSWPVEPCSDGYEYNKTEVSSSVVIDVSFFKFVHILTSIFYQAKSQSNKNM